MRTSEIVRPCAADDTGRPARMAGFAGGPAL